MPMSATRMLASLAAVTALLAGAAWLRRNDLPPPTIVASSEAAATLEREIADEFGMANPIVWIVEARDGSVWTKAGLERITKLTREVLTLEGVIATDVIGLASPNMRDVKLTDGDLEQIYLMGDVPADEEGIRELRARVDGDPNYAGTLVTRDGRAALLVANFMTDVDQAALARAALELRDRYRDEATDVWVVGAPVLGAVATRAAGLLGAAFGVVLVVAFCAAAVLLGPAVAVAAGVAALLSCLWTALALVAVRDLSLPWSLWSFPVIALVTSLVTIANGGDRMRRSTPALVPLWIGCAALARVAGEPLSGVGLATALGSLFAVGTGAAMGAFVSVSEPRRLAIENLRILRLLALGAIALLSLGCLSLRFSFGLPGYGERYLTPATSADLRAMRRLFPPPSTFVLRWRGEPGFVARPEVLRAMSDLEDTARSSPGVRGTQSLAGVIKTVNRTFNEGRPEFYAIPGDRGMNARYLTLAYSPLFRRFVDRSLSRAAVWVLVDGDRPDDLEAVRRSIEAFVAAQHLEGVTIDPLAGDGVATLAMAGAARRLAAGTAALLVVLAVGGAVVAGLSGSLAVLAAGVVAVLAGAGLLGWLGLPIDLVAAAVLTCSAAIAGLAALLALCGLGAESLPRFAAALAIGALAALAIPFAVLRVMALLLLAPLASAATTLRRAVKP
jgi:hypothetical protein